MRNNYLKLLIIPSLFFNWNYSQDLQFEQFFDGPHCFYNGDSLNINYFNYGTRESFNMSSQDTNMFNGYLQDSLVNYSIPSEFQTESDSYSQSDKIFVVSDIHGQYEIFEKLLRTNGIIDENNLWIWGDGHLVVVGDVFDRGDYVHETLWLIYNLENQAKLARGKVHVILGNHEIMVLQDDLRYVDEKYFAVSELFQIELPELYNKNTFWGRWLRSKNFISTIGSTLFVHGGIHPELINKYNSITEINSLMRKNIDTDRETIKSDQVLSDLFRSKGPIWHRGFFVPESLPAVSESELNDILNHFGSEKIIVGHTTEDSIYYSHEGKIICVDGGIKYGIRAEGLLIIKENYYVVDSEGKRRLLF